MEAQLRGLPALLEALRAERFRAGPAEAVAAGRLLLRLGQTPGAPQRPHDWLLWLRPVFCSSREEQDRFDDIFKAWADGVERTRDTQDQPGQTLDQATDSTPPSPWWQRRRPMAVAAAGALALVLLVAALVFSGTGAKHQPTEPPTPLTNPGGVRAPRSYVPEAASELPALQPQGFFPAVRELRSLNPWLVWPLVLAPAGLLLLVGGLPGLSLLQGRQRSGRPVVLDTRRLEEQARDVLPPLSPDVAGRLERHLRDDGTGRAPLSRRRRLDARRTVEATLRRPGRLSLRWRNAPLRPSYLVLIDANDESDPRGRLFAIWAERLRRQGLDVSLRSFARGADDSRAPEARRLGARHASTPGVLLDQLPDPPMGQRLVVVSEAAAWVDETGRWHPWFVRARLHRWRRRAFFTPTELRDWGDREEAIETPEHAADPGFLLLPLDESALDAWSVLLAQGRLPEFSLHEPQRYPRVLAAPGFDPWTEPEHELRERLVAQLMLYLGDSGFRWLCMLAVPPLVRWELSLMLGRQLFEQRFGPVQGQALEVLARSWRRLTRLPWLRGGHAADGSVRAPALPAWLRTRLLDELTPAAHEELRSIVDDLLSRVRQGPGTLTLDFEAPPARGAGQADATPGDVLYLGYLSGLTPAQLAQRVPDPWREWLRQRPLPGPRWAALWRRGTQGAGAWLHAGLSRLVFKDGLPWAGRTRLTLVLAVAWWAGLGAAISWLSAQPREGLPAMLEAAAFPPQSRAVEPPSAADALDVSLSADGRTGLIRHADGRLRLWDTRSGRVVRDIPGGPNVVSARLDGVPALSVLACQRGGRVDAWPLINATATQPTRLPAGAAGCERPYGRYRFDGKGATDTQTGNQRALRWAGRPDESIPVWMAPSRRDGGAALAALTRSGESRSIEILPLQGPERLVLQLEDEDGRITALALSADTRYAVSGNDEGEVALWDTRSGKRLARQRRHDSAIRSLQLSDAGDVLLSRDVREGFAVSQSWQPAALVDRQGASLAAFSARGERAVLASAAGPVWFYDGTQFAARESGFGLPQAEQLSLAPDGQQVALAAGPQVLRGRLPPWGQRADRVPSPEISDLGAPVLALAHLADGRLLALGAQGRVRVWPAGAGQPPQDISTGVRARAWAWHASGKLAMVDDDPTLLHLLDLQQGRVRRALAGAALQEPALAFSPDGDSLWVASAGVTRRHDFASGAVQATLAERPDAAPIRLLRVAPDGRVAQLDTAGRLVVQRPGASRQEDLGALATDVADVQWLADGTQARLLLARRDGLVQSWPVDATRAPLNLHERADRLVTAADGRRVMALSQPRGSTALAALWVLPQRPWVAPTKVQFSSAALWHPVVLLALMAGVLWGAFQVSEWRLRRVVQ